MKTAIFCLSLLLGISACNSNDDTQGSDSPSNTTDQPKDQPGVQKPAASDNPEIQKGLELVASTGCFQCHNVSDKLVGPAYADVSDRYKGQPGNIDTLVHRIVNGSVGKWGTIPMPPNAVSKEDARAMAAYILSLQK
ncbi:MAG TPA: c-type cytochrome [Flavisolibacter sp.]|nr:c-type cytochrome [Flavisolibacter sp.]